MQDLVPAFVGLPLAVAPAPGPGWIDPIAPGPAGEVPLFALPAAARIAFGRRAEVPGLPAEAPDRLPGRRVR